MQQSNKLFYPSQTKSSPINKVLFTLLILFLYRLCNTIPLTEIDQSSLEQSFSGIDKTNGLVQILSMYSGGGTKLSAFSLGIIPYINASILIDLVIAVVPSLEKLQSEEGEFGRRKINFFKKVATFIFSLGQSYFLVQYLKSYLYQTSIFYQLVLICELSVGAMILVWLSNLIDNKGIGNGTSLIILINILTSFFQRINFQSQLLDSTFPIQLLILFTLLSCICFSQIARIRIDVVSARQLAFLENIDNEKIEKTKGGQNVLSIKFNQAGIFPLIIASNIIPFLSFLIPNLFPRIVVSFVTTTFYYFLIVAFNYFYTNLFWDPEKIAEQLRKASVSIVNVSPGKDTVIYLERVVRSSSILGGLFLCTILLFFDFVKQFINSPLLNQLNVSSLIIVVGVCYDLQKTLKALFQTVF
jgi:preprotein translocase subunit SecY